MKKTLTFLCLMFSINCISQTQVEMSRNAYALFQSADKELNKVYTQILSDYKLDTLFIDNLKKAQGLWIQFRDAELDMKYPAYRGNHYGSIQPMCRALYLKELTENRTETLKTWLTGIGEGDGCIGSVKTK